MTMRYWEPKKDKPTPPDGATIRHKLTGHYLKIGGDFVYAHFDNGWDKTTLTPQEVYDNDNFEDLDPWETAPDSALDTQIGGDHYKDFEIQPVQFSEANGLSFLEGCVVKRVARHGKPTGKGRQDIEKAIHELQLLLELRYNNNQQE